MSISAKISIIFLIGGLTFGYAFYHRQKYRDYFEYKHLLVLKELPEFSLKNVLEKTRDGDLVTSEDIFWNDAKMSMVHFWATWCGPCEAEIPEFINLAKKYKDQGLNFLLVAVNDESKKIKKFLKRFGTLPSNIKVLHDTDGTTGTRFGTVKLPETYLFGNDGKNLNKYIGAQNWHHAGIKKRLDFYLRSL